MADGIVTLRVADGSREGIERKMDAIVKVVDPYVAGLSRVDLEARPTAGKGGRVVDAAPRPGRLNEASANAERLKVLREKDPTLNAAVEALDLELLE